jgi:23S rRNA pseudouridine1911/1915/1917 synthase
MDISELILYENDDYIIAKKPFGLLSEEDPAGSQNLRELLESYLKQKYPWKKQMICQLTNRLDKPVGGILICAKKQSILKEIQLQFYSRNVQKYYFAITEGSPQDSAKRLEHYLVKSQTEFKAIPASPETQGAKLAKLYYRVISSNDQHSLLLVQLHTGKYHQIRFQLSQIGHPIWNDEWYGAKRMHPDFKIGLFSFFIGFTEPRSGEFKQYSLSPPDTEPWSMFSTAIQNILNQDIVSILNKLS